VELSEVTSPEVIGNHVTETDRVRMCNRFPRFFLTIVVVQNVPLKREFQFIYPIRQKKKQHVIIRMSYLL
jgi:hypothetical protein